jgi:hypothetical protein
MPPLPQVSSSSSESPWWLRAGAAAVLVSVVLQAAGCDDDLRPRAEPPEDRGERLTDGEARPDHLAWSPDGREIYFDLQVTSERVTLATIQAVDRHARAIRTVSRELTAHEHFRLSADGSDVYIVGFGGNPGGRPADRGIYRVAAAGGEAGLVAGTWQARVSAPALSPDGLLVAYALEDTLHLQEIAGSARWSPGRGEPIAFSPDGAEVVYRGIDRSVPTGTAPLYRVATGEGSIPEALPRCGQWTVRDVSWEGGGLRALAYATAYEGADRTIRLATLDLPSCAERVFGEIRGSEFWFGAGAELGWTAAGDQAALWLMRDCLAGLLQCSRAHWTLHHFDLRGGAERQIGSAIVREVPSRPYFSPDGASLAYALDGAVHVRDLR